MHRVPNLTLELQTWGPVSAFVPIDRATNAVVRVKNMFTTATQTFQPTQLSHNHVHIE